MFKRIKQSPLFRNHLSAVVVSILLNLGLFLAFMTLITFSETGDQPINTINVIRSDNIAEEILEPEELLPPEEVDSAENVEDTSFKMSDFVSENLDTTIPEEQAVIASPVASPIILEGLTQAMGGVSLDGIARSGNATSFMGQKATGNRFAFIIDYSKSMNNTQLAIMKQELTSALAAIGEKGLATVLFFSGPVWRPDENAKEAESRWKGDNWTTNWRLKEGAEGPNPQWLVPDRRNMAALQRMIYQTPTTGGTDWYPPMKTVLEMQPRPDIIFFMTDGKTSKDSSDKTIDLIKKVHKNVQVNTVALGVKEDDVPALKELARITGGKFRRYGNQELRDMKEKLPEVPENFDDTTLKYLSQTEVLLREQTTQRNTPLPTEEKDLVTFEID